MTEPTAPSDMEIRTGTSRSLGRLSLIWLVPVLALVVSLGVAWQSYADRGPVIEIAFENASGITAETEIKYRDVRVGIVEKVDFSEGLDVVLVHARMDKNVAPYLDDDAQFWVVRPDVSVRGITGLDTVLSGAYLEGSWDTEADVQQFRFNGLEVPPLATRGQQGTEIVLRARDGAAMSKGAPVLLKGIEVGFLETPELTPGGNEVRVNAFIRAPFDRRITTATKFWDTSGFSISFGAGGVALDVSSIASLIEGGIAFDTVVSGGQPIRDGAVFDLFADEDSARLSLFDDPDSELLNLSVMFDGSVSGLSVGSEVMFQGIRIGSVAELNAVAVEAFDATRVQLRATLAIEPGRLGLGQDATPDDALAFINDFVDQGMRARMVTGNILTGSLKVELVTLPELTPGVLKLDADPYPVLPTAPNLVSDVAASAEGVLQRINDLPVEELLDGAINLMSSIETLVNDEGLREVPVALTGLLEDTRALVGSPDIQAVPAELSKILADIDTIVSSATEANLIAQLNSALEAANVAATSVADASVNLPQITAELEQLVAKANGLEVENLVNQTTQTLQSIDTLIGSDATADLPASLSQALDELRLFLAEVREGGAIENVNAALASASEAARAIEQAAASLPALSTRTSSLVSETERVIAGFGDGSRFNAETLSTLRNIQAAADAVSSLARAIQRNPNSLLVGR